MFGERSKWKSHQQASISWRGVGGLGVGGWGGGGGEKSDLSSSNTDQQPMQMRTIIVKNKGVYFFYA